MGESRAVNWRRMINRYISLATSIVGMILVLTSIFYISDLQIWLFLVISGLLVLLLGVWYATNPILTSERRYLALRGEVDDFIELVRELNRAAISGQEDEVERVKAEMFHSVERMAELAGKEGPGPGQAASATESLAGGPAPPGR